MQDTMMWIVDRITRFISHHTHDPVRQAEDPSGHYRMCTMRLLLDEWWHGTRCRLTHVLIRGKQIYYKVTELTNNLLLIQLLMSLITLILPRNSWKRTLERFCQNVSELVHSAHQFQLNLVDALSVEVVLHLYVLASAMKNRILTQGNR
jgi:hypothetical protein